MSRDNKLKANEDLVIKQLLSSRDAMVSSTADALIVEARKIAKKAEDLQHTLDEHRIVTSPKDHLQVPGK